eukprot:14193928-Alexandrium_andersonii.AAC.1
MGRRAAISAPWTGLPSRRPRSRRPRMTSVWTARATRNPHCLMDAAVSHACSSVSASPVRAKARSAAWPSCPLARTLARAA